MGDAGAATYAPDPAGLATARAAVGAEYGRRGVRIDPARIVLTASTSEAYGWLFKLLCDAGDHVLVPQPSYPLFDWLTRLEAVEARPYRCEFHGAWTIDRATLEAAVTPRTRAVLVVSPNNPTGACLGAADREWLVPLCAARGLALIADEVFIDYPLTIDTRGCDIAGERRVLTFALGGLSKSVGLPQVKLGWIAVSGPNGDAAAAIERLHVIADTYLSVSTPVQVATPRLLDAGRAVRASIQARVTRNLAALRRAIAAHPSLALLPPEAGWSAVLRVPSTIGEEALVLRLLEDAHVLVHPGYFFDFPTEAYLVVSLLTSTSIFDEGMLRLVRVAS
jgi:aspartate/methionine/tyrosine aminotransferase